MVSEPQFEIVGEQDGIPIKRYAAGAHGILGKPLRFNPQHSALEYERKLPPAYIRPGSPFATTEQFNESQKLARARRKEFKRQIEQLRAQRLAVLGSKPAAPSSLARLTDKPSTHAATPHEHGRKRPKR